MDPYSAAAASSDATNISYGDGGAEIAAVRSYCADIRRRIDLIPSSKLPLCYRERLLSFLKSEVGRLARLTPPLPPTVKLFHLDPIVSILHHPSILAVSRICQPVIYQGIRIDIACTFHRCPAWVILSTSNINNMRWFNVHKKPRGVGQRVERFLDAARATSPAFRPDTLLFVFSKGVDEDIIYNMETEFGAVEVDFVGEMEYEAVLENAMVFEIRIAEGGIARQLESRPEVVLRGGGFTGLMEAIAGKDDEGVDLVNFDTTVLVTMVSGMTNGEAAEMIKLPEKELRRRCKEEIRLSYEYIMQQVNSELAHPNIPDLEAVVAGKKCIVCQSVCSEFKEIVSVWGGVTEKQRAEELLKHVLVVPDSPSARLLDLPTQRKISMKNKISFGTGDHWHAPTLTGNMRFVGAVSETGMSLLTIGHRPVSLTGI